MRFSRPWCFAFLVVGLVGRAPAQQAIGLEGNTLRPFDLTVAVGAPPPVTLLPPPIPITGMAPGESLVGIDYRPANRTLVGVSSQNRVYQLNLGSGRATVLSTLSMPLAGSNFGVDFNPVTDRLRVVSDTGQNLDINVDTGAVTTDNPIDYRLTDTGAGRFARVKAVAHTNAIAGRTAASTALFGIDSDRHVLVRQDPPADGLLTTVGVLTPAPASGSVFTGFDIFGASAGFAVRASDLAPARSTDVYRVDLATGAATFHASYSDAVLIDIAIVPKEPAQGMINTSARGTVTAGEGTLIAGFVVGGNAPINVLVTTRGPSLGAFRVANPVPDTRVEIFSGTARLDTNGNWSAHPRAAEIAATGFGPTSTREGAVIVALPPGAYTAVITPVGATSGVGLVEVYELP